MHKNNWKNGKENIVLKVIIGMVIAFVVFIVLFFALIFWFAYVNQIKNSINESKDNSNIVIADTNSINIEISEEELFIGTWDVYVNDKKKEGNYFTFNTDGTYSMAASTRGVSKGNYIFEDGINLRSGGEIYNNGNYIYYYIMLTPTSVELNDGRVITENLNKTEYALAINSNEMQAQNLLSRNVT